MPEIVLVLKFPSLKKVLASIKKTNIYIPFVQIQTISSLLPIYSDNKVLPTLH